MVVGGRYGLASKEFTPAMAKTVLDSLAAERPRNHFTVGIADDVSHTSLPVDGAFATEDAEGLRAVFFGLGSDGTVGANKTSVKIIGEGTDRFAQGYFVLDSKKSGSVTVSHLRIASRPIRATYLIGPGQATFIACHQFHFLDRMDVLGRAAQGATFLLNSPWSADQVWDHLPVEVQQEVIDKGLALWVVDAARVARDAGMGHRINTGHAALLLRPFRGVAPRAGDRGHQGMGREGVQPPGRGGGGPQLRRHRRRPGGAAQGWRSPPGRPAPAIAARPCPRQAPDFVKRVTARMLEGNGDLLPVSALPVDGAFPTGTARWEKRQLAAEIPIWDPSICIDCGKCAIVCPHSTIRTKVFAPEALEGAPDGFAAKDFRARDLPGMKLTVQVAPDDCTGCGVCVEVCPAHSKEEVKHKAINMTPVDAFLERERERWDFFRAAPRARP
jgi:pyruvate-ferredoxin/flavodoxin oxidoreductase